MTFSNPIALIGLLALPLILWLGWPRGAWGRGRKIAALVLRTLIVLSLVLGLAGLQIVQAADQLAVVFLIDASDSMPPASIESAREVVQEAIRAMRPTDQAAIIVFGSDALVERPMSAAREVGPFESRVLPLHTDLAEAIRLGLALYPPGAARRMVILSDGLANVGDAEEAARLAAASGVQIMAVPYAATLGPEVLVTEVNAPTRLSENQQFDLGVTIESSQETTAELRILGGGEVLLQQGIQLVEGPNRYAFTLTAPGPGLNTFRVQVVPTGDDIFYQNNELSAFTQVVGPPRVLVVTDDPAESANIEDALLAQGLLVDRTSGAGLPADLATLSAYQSIVMTNVPARSLGPRKMEVIQAYVRDLGGGLVMVGGPNAYGPGGYFQTPIEETLPVEMQLKDQERLPQMSVVYVIDTSGSMADYSPGGFPKIELAKEAILRSLQLFGPLDRIGVASFDTDAAWVVPLAPADDRARIGALVAGLRARGGTDIYAGLLAVSRVLPNDPSQLRHIVLLTDGGASEAGIRELVTEMYEEHGITLSVIAITGEGEQYGAFLEDLPELAGGRFHHANNVDSIPEIFTEETIVATRAYIIEHEFAPVLTSTSPILSGIDAVPPLYGYIGASMKPAAQQILATDMDDPLLAAWQYGLGRAVAWTSDGTGRWASSWVAWEDFARFWSQAVRWTITEGANQNVEVQVRQEGERVRITVDALAEDGSYLDGVEMTASVVAPNLSATTLELRQVAPGRYEGVFEPEDEGAYFVRVAGADDDTGEAAVAQTSGWVLAYSPEYRSFEGDPAYLEYIAGLTGGSVVEDPADIFVHDLRAERASQPVWPWLLLFAVILLPFDIAVRRLVLTRSDLARLVAWLGIGRQQAQPVERGTSRVGSLLDVKERASRELDAAPRAVPPPAEPAAPSAPRQPKPQEPAPRRETPRRQPEGSTVSSLLASKRRRSEGDER
ncbi:MAG TPA: VWA domain-containing protein [Aggregatilineales bacterium]|nr:VWA domain-containing protein [Aggregatilineales bacterium]